MFELRLLGGILLPCVPSETRAASARESRGLYRHSPQKREYFPPLVVTFRRVQLGRQSDLEVELFFLTRSTIELLRYTIFCLKYFLHDGAP